MVPARLVGRVAKGCTGDRSRGLDKPNLSGRERALRDWMETVTPEARPRRMTVSTLAVLAVLVAAGPDTELCGSDLARRAKLTSISTVYPILARRSEEHTSELQSRENLVCRLLLEKKKKKKK